MDEKEVFEAIGDKLKALRKAKGYTNYEHLAYDLGISRSQYGKYEKGANMKISTLIKILNHFEISLEDFFTEDSII